jgi:alginate O-acetyltransferase complex protein AlgI
MLFNSIDFLIFLPIVFILYWALNKYLKVQNLLLLVSSYLFYGWWDWRFLLLLVFSTLLDYFSGIYISKSEKLTHKKIWFTLSISLNLFFLGIFKYFNFFSESFQSLLNSIGLNGSPLIIDVVLPVGISFYTFHGLSYVIDIYKKRIEPNKDFITYSIFVSYFPLLVAGPIERATHLLPQINLRRIFSFENALLGLRLISWGYFKKVAIADSISPSVSDIFDNFSSYPSGVLFLGAFYFSIQIYCDFSGYSDIARGVSKLFGIELYKNFNHPYFSRSISEFWRKWHISLSSWFRDYVYIPLGGSKGAKWTAIRNIFIIFLLSGFWHGANWTFIVWGAYHAFLFIPSFIIGSNRKEVNLPVVNFSGNIFKGLLSFLKILITFFLVTIGWVFFRSETIYLAKDYLVRAFSFNLYNFPIEYLNPYDNSSLFFSNILIVLMVIIDFSIMSINEKNIQSKLFSNLVLNSIGILALIYLTIFSIHIDQSAAFIYFQF